ncbi:DgyrCDS12153 [Dimorphilus gyrociliatus]|uniref:DgyrCDS12153 n=1 Tax=Dimorphilus gyrociliatus TaxID=2664684 RepID=A0A7I8W5L9_9ANNE|nr:DgyrCDS12153 [Dimorphilus gyrociliatus]
MWRIGFRLAITTKINPILRNGLKVPLSTLKHPSNTIHRRDFQRYCSTKVGKISPQMAITFTCKVCEQRTTRTFSKISYEKGVVIIKCPGCNNNHLIADNLGWFRDKKINIEDLMKEKGEDITKLKSEGLIDISEK